LTPQGDEYWNPLVPELTVRDLDVSLRFYLRAGFRIRFKRDNPPFAYLELGQAQIMLEQEHAEGWNINPLDRPLGRGINLQIEVKDARETLESLAGYAAIVFRKMTDSWYRVSSDNEEGQREFLVQDPDGYLLRFSQYLGSRKCITAR
jgi:catechol 2,3-dioxygenase-like lactoylglutathione lyase family enzyme